MSQKAQSIVVVKTNPPTNSENVILPDDPARDLYMSRRQAIMIELAALDRILGLKRKCKTCGKEA